MRKRIRTTYLLLLAVAVVLAACGQAAGGAPTPSPTPTTTRPSSSASISILRPLPSALIRTTTMPVQFQLSGGRIVQQASTHLTPDEGHIHLSIDGRLISMNYQLEQEVSLQAFNPGPHVLQGEFVALDHGPFNPRVLVKLVFEYEPGSS
jgi:hypothetical protein